MFFKRYIKLPFGEKIRNPMEARAESTVSSLIASSLARFGEFEEIPFELD